MTAAGRRDALGDPKMTIDGAEWGQVAVDLLKFMQGFPWNAQRFEGQFDLLPESNRAR